LEYPEHLVVRVSPAFKREVEAFAKLHRSFVSEVARAALADLVAQVEAVTGSRPMGPGTLIPKPSTAIASRR